MNHGTMTHRANWSTRHRRVPLQRVWRMLQKKHRVERSGRVFSWQAWQYWFRTPLRPACLRRRDGLLWRYKNGSRA